MIANVLGQDKVWRGRPLSEFTVQELLSAVAHLHRDAELFAERWCSDLSKEPHQFIAESKLMCGLWFHIFRLRGRFNGPYEDVSD